jgi:hypothetical protein
MRKIVAASVAVCAVIVIACGGGSGQIGADCSGDAECSGVSTQSSPGVCASGFEVCTRACTEHQDCGCANGTTNETIADGKCGNACVGGACVRVCANNSQCRGQTACSSAEDANGNSLGYSVCD